MGSSFLKDDLFFTQETAPYDGGIQLAAKIYKQNPDSQVSIKGHTILLYHLAKNKIHDPECFKLLEEQLYNYREQYNPRLAYGGLYGVYSSNQSSVYAINFFEEEYSRTLEFQGPHGAARILIAIANNTVKSLEQRRKYAEQILLGKIKQHYKQFIRNRSNYELGIYDSLIKLQIHDKEIWELFFEGLKNFGCKDIFKVSKLYTDLIELNNSKRFYRDIQPEINILEKYISGNQDLAWRYDLEQKRLRTYDELVQISSQLDISKKPYLEKTQGLYHKINTEAHEEYQKFKENRVEKQSEEIIKEKQKDLQNLLYEQFMLKQLGEDVESDLIASSDANESEEYVHSEILDLDKDLTSVLKGDNKQNQKKNQKKQK